MVKITKDEWEKVPNDYKGRWTKEVIEWRGGDVPKEWEGKRNMLTYDEGTCLITESVHFEIVEA